MKIPENVRFTSFCAGVIGDLFFDFVMRMKDSWRAGIPDRNKTKLVTDGIYKYSHIRSRISGISKTGVSLFTLQGGFDRSKLKGMENLAGILQWYREKK